MAVRVIYVHSVTVAPPRSKPAESSLSTNTPCATPSRLFVTQIVTIARLTKYRDSITILLAVASTVHDVIDHTQQLSVSSRQGPTGARSSVLFTF